MIPVVAKPAKTPLFMVFKTEVMSGISPPKAAPIKLRSGV
jgi:hypothetical protein